jgi:hypothetical protein
VTAELHCPICHEALTMVSRRQDYFCGPCHTAVCLDDETCYVYQIGLDKSFTVSASTLAHPSVEASSA